MIAYLTGEPVSIVHIADQKHQFRLFGWKETSRAYSNKTGEFTVVYFKEKPDVKELTS